MKNNENKRIKKIKRAVGSVLSGKCFKLGYSGQVAGENGYGGITDPDLYVNDRYGAGWVLEKEREVAGITPHKQSEFEPHAENCTLSSITCIFEYYKNKGIANTPANAKEIYSDVKAAAEKHKYSQTHGTDFWVIDNVVNDLWKKYGRKGKGNNDYLFTFETFKSEIDASRPLVFNIVSGYYYNHSITVVGYKVYVRNKLDSKKCFLKVFDNRTTEDRYIDYSAFYGTLGNVTRINPGV